MFRCISLHTFIIKLVEKLLHFPCRWAPFMLWYLHICILAWVSMQISCCDICMFAWNSSRCAPCKYRTCKYHVTLTILNLIKPSSDLCGCGVTTSCVIGYNKGMSWRQHDRLRNVCQQLIVNRMLARPAKCPLSAAIGLV